HATEPPHGGDRRRPADPGPGAGAADGTVPAAPPRGGAVSAPAPRALPDTLALGRALRPLKRRTPSASRFELDEVATTEAIAQTGLLQGVLRPQQEPWLRLALVVERGLAMQVWEDQIGALRALLERTGAFRRIDRFGLHWSEPERRPVLTRHRGGPTEAVLSPLGITSAAERTMVLVVSDGSSALWADGRMAPLLHAWAEQGPTAIVHALPRRLWPGSGITTTPWQTAAPAAGRPNSTWRTTDPVLPPELAPYDGQMAIPVLALTPASLTAWVQTTTVPGRPALQHLWSGSAEPPEPARTDPADRLAHFLRTASPEARRLAAHLAARGTVTMPVMQLINAYANGPDNTAALAEVVLGGPLHHPAGDGADPADTPHLRFSVDPGATDALLDLLSLDQLLDCNEHVSRQLERLAGRSAHFPAWLRPPCGDVPFALLSDPLRIALGLPPVDVPQERPGTPERPAGPAPAPAPAPAADRFTAEVRSLLDRERRIDPRRPEAPLELLALAAPHASIEDWSRIRDAARDLAERFPADYRRGLAWALDQLGSRLALADRVGDALAAAEECAELLDGLVGEPGSPLAPRRVEALLTLGNRLRAADASRAAQDADRRAVAAYEELDEADRAALAPPIERTLQTLRVRTAQAGATEETIAELAAAVAELRRAPATDDGQRTALALALGDLAEELLGADRYDEALAPAEECLDHHRRLAAAGAPPSQAHASALGILGTVLLTVGRADEAVDAALERVALLRALAEAGELVSLELADALDDLAIWLPSDRLPEALAASGESVAVLRQLAAAAPELSGDLAWSLNTHGRLLALADRPEEAVAAAEERVRALRATANPGGQLRRTLAEALETLADRLLTVDRAEEATTAATEAAGLLRELTETDLLSHGAALSRVLRVLDQALHRTERHEEAAAVDEERVALVRDLVVIDPAAFRPELVDALGQLALEHSHVDRTSAASAAAREAVALAHGLADRSLLSWTQDILAIVLARNGDVPEAVAVAAERVDLVRGLLAENRDTYGPELADALFSLATLLSRGREFEPVVTAAAEAVELYQEFDSPESLAAVLGVLGRSLASLGRHEEAVDVSARQVAVLRGLPDPEGHRSDLADALLDLAIRHNEVGRYEDAIPVGREAVDLHRLLAAADGHDARISLSWALNSLHHSLVQADRGSDAVPTAEESVALLRELAAADPDGHLPQLAAALNILALGLAVADREDEALTAALEAVDLYRRLTRDADTHRPGLARTLNTLQRRFAEAGREAEALAAAEEGIALLRPLADADPATYTGDLVDALAQLSDLLVSLGHYADALEAAGEAVAIARAAVARAAEERDAEERDAEDRPPGADLPDLTTALRALGRQLTTTGQYEGAVAVMTERVDLLRVLAAADPAEHRRTLARALGDLAFALIELGREAEALAAAQEAAAMFRELGPPPDEQPDELLTTILSPIARLLNRDDRFAEAVAATEERIALLRPAADGPVRHRAALADALDDLASYLSRLDRPAEALAAALEAVALGRDLARPDLPGHGPGLAWALSTAALRLEEAGRPADALDAFRERVAVLRRLSDHDPAAHLATLHHAVRMLADRLTTHGLGDELSALALETVGRTPPGPSTDDEYLTARLDALGELTDDLVYVGRSADALPVTAAHVAVLREAVGRDGARFTDRLAAALQYHGRLLSGVERFTESVAACEEAVALLEGPAGTGAPEHAAALADALDDLALRLGEAGRTEEALAAARTAVARFRELVAHDPEAGLPGLGWALQTLDQRLTAVGAQDEALDAAAERVRVLARLAEQAPGAHDRAYAEAGELLAIRLDDHGRPEEAVPLLDRAVRTYRELHRASPEAHRTDLAHALGNLAYLLAGTGQPQSALAAVEEAIALVGGRARDVPAEEQPFLAWALGVRVATLRDLDRPADALASARRRVDVLRGLVRQGPGYTADLAEALRDLSGLLPTAGAAPAEAAAARREAEVLEAASAEE
ncbi:tetratricopeptide repeat protein, partial [Kitasatospora sp. NPDC004799]|uniref:tetratricopeptide repeat protein n=1 Tax=Kitasatospora sp. NPDC004799 TaxID=3154460 RepID=UPI0033BA7B26